MNKAILLGRLGRDPETRYTGGDIHVHYTANVHAIDRRGMEEALAGHGETIVKLIREQKRQFKF